MKRLKPLLEAHAHNTFYGEPNIISSYSSERKEKIIQTFFSEIETLVTNGTLQSFRKNFVDAVMQTAKLQILCLTEAEKEEIPAFRDEKLISGTLYKNIKEHLRISPESWPIEQNVTQSEVITTCNKISVEYRFRMVGLDIYRQFINDNKEAWVAPFINAMFIWEENNYRKNLGQECLTVKKTNFGTYDSALEYFVFGAIVLEGSKKPFSEWESTKQVRASLAKIEKGLTQVT